MKKFDPDYEGGKCPYGYLFVESFSDSHGTYHQSYCRKIPKFRTDPELAANRNKQRLERQSWKAAEEAYSEAHGNSPSETEL